MSILNVSLDTDQIVNISCMRRDSFDLSIEVANDDTTDFDFTGYTAKIEVRKTSDSTVIETFSTSDSSIILTPGEVQIIKSAITGVAGDYLYDLQIDNGTTKKTIVKGKFKINSDITI